MNRTHDTVATLFSLFAAIATWQEQLEWGLRIAAAIVAIAAGLHAIYHRRRRRQ
jgi:hypothetical protein